MQGAQRYLEQIWAGTSGNPCYPACRDIVATANLEDRRAAKENSRGEFTNVN